MEAQRIRRPLDSSAPARRGGRASGLSALRTAVLVLTIAIAIAASGCRDGESAEDPGTVSSASTGEVSPTTSSTPPAATSGPSAPSPSGPSPTSAGGVATTAPGAGAGTDPVTNSPDLSQPWLGQPDVYSPLRAVRVGGHDGFDRVVFEFDGEVPGYLVAYGPPTLAATDDSPVTVTGGAGLAVTLFGGGQWLLDPAAVPRQVVADTVAVTEARQIDDFEAVNRWLVGVDRQRPFQVSTLDGPSRLVIDVVRDD
jgi:hypothetical protein